jgi:hypothetical protein
MGSTKPAWQQTLVQYVCWLGASVLAVVDLLMIREALISFLLWNQVRIQNIQRAQGLLPEKIQSGFTTEAIVLTATFILGIIAVGVMIWAEYYFRKGAAIGKLFQRIGIVLGTEVGIIVLSVIVQMVFG